MNINFLRFHLPSMMAPMLAVLLFCHCKKEDEVELQPISVVTVDATAVNTYSVDIPVLISGAPYSQLFCGVAYSTSPNPEVSDQVQLSNRTSFGETGDDAFLCNLTSLSFNTTYYARGFAVNALGIFYGRELIFTTGADTTINYGSLTDFDGNTYRTLVINQKEWMIDNLRTSHFRNGRAIPMITANSDWANTTGPASCWYDNDSASYHVLYGKLYNLNAINDTNQLCPNGWHVPTFMEFIDLRNEVGGPLNAGGEMKSKGTAYWESPNTGATNSSKFTGLPGGRRTDAGEFLMRGYYGSWGTVSDPNAVDFYSLTLINNSSEAHAFYWPPGYGVSVRCVKD